MESFGADHRPTAEAREGELKKHQAIPSVLGESGVPKRITENTIHLPMERTPIGVQRQLD